MAESLSEMPPNILSEILSKLPTKTIFASRCVCKDFLNLTSSNPHFNSLISLNPTQNLLIQLGSTYDDPSILLHLVDSELEFDKCDFGKNFDIKPIFQIPQYPPEHFEQYRRYPEDENEFVLINSCNGLLYFAEQRVWERSFVCNPVTNEYLALHKHVEKLQEETTMSLWLGFSEGENQYKILRIFSSVTGRVSLTDFKEEFWAQINVVGSRSWRDIEDKPPPYYLSWGTHSVFVNGVIYWLCRFPNRPKFILLFDFEKENFGEILPPPELAIEWMDDRYLKMGIGVLGSDLCVIDNSYPLVDVWFMDKCGSQTSWIKKFVVDTSIPTGKPLAGPFRPLQYLKNGEILMMWMGVVLMCYDPEKESFRVFEFIGVTSLANAVVFTRSFVPLKDALMVDSARVQNMPRVPDQAEAVDADGEAEYMNLDMMFSDLAFLG